MDALRRRRVLTGALRAAFGGRGGFAAVALALAVLAPPAAADDFAPGATAPADSFLRQYAATYRFRLGRPSSIALTPDGRQVLYLRSGPRSFVQDLYAFDTATGRERVLLTADSILRGAAESLSPEEKAQRERLRLAARGIARYQLSRDGRRLLVPLSGHLFLVEREGGRVEELETDAGPAFDPQFSPDGTRMASVRDGDLYVMDLAGGEERRLAAHEGADVTCGEAEHVAQEEMDRFHGFWWSPGGTRLAFQRTDVSRVERLSVGDPTHPETPPDARPYPRPGKANADVTLGIVPVTGGPVTWVSWDRSRYPYLCAVKWEEGAPLTLVVMDRAQREEVVLAADSTTGSTQALWVERDAAWLNLDPDMPRWLPDGRSFLWTSERGGEWQLELHTREGRLVWALTPKGFGYRGLAALDAKRGEAWVTAGPDPTERHVYRVPLNPRKGSIERLTREPGLHAATVSENGDVWVHGFEGLGPGRPVTVQRRDGRELGRLPSVSEMPLLDPTVELGTVGDSLRFHTAVVRPRRTVPGRRYPVVLDVYAGPHYQSVLATRWRYLLDQWLADRGFVVVAIDGRGTPARGRAWERALAGSFIEAPLADQVAGLRALAREHPELDLTRVGMVGWSFGGYFSALALMRRPDVFAAAVAGAPVTDWRDYDTFYTERYLGLPSDQPEAYARSSVLESAAELTRPLLVIHGTDDDNVYFSNSLKLCDALFRAGRPFEFLPLDGFTHMVADPVVTERLETRIADFLARTLGAPR